MYYIICSCPRSGSSLLSEALLAMGAGKPDEYFNPIAMRGNELNIRKDFMQPTVETYIERIKQDYTVNGIFGLKTHHTHLARIPHMMERMGHFFPNANYISITRRNSLRQAISATRATQTRSWTSHLPQQQIARFSYFGIVKHLVLAAQEIELWEKFYAVNHIKPLRILYEDLDEDYENTMRKVISFLGLSGDIPAPPMVKQSDALTEVWIERFSTLFRGNGMLSRIARRIAARR